MKKKYIVFGTFALTSFLMKAQNTDSIFKKEKISRTEIEVLYSHYMQNGNHSPVTGGIGTEKLTVYAPAAKLKTTFKSNSISLSGGLDVVSSASTDNINFITSSASKTDVRMHVNGVYAHTFEKQKIGINAGTGFSLESDYFSVPVSFGISYVEKNNMRTYSIDTKMYFDDLRYGRLLRDYKKPVYLIYPVELRYKEWYDTYLRKSYNVKVGFTQVINKRNVIGIYPEIDYQKGLLATPFHRVYFTDSSLRVENLPEKRLKGILGIKLNSFAGGMTILRNGIDLYADNFGVLGIAIENETALKITSQFTLTPSFRLYFQKGSKYFAPYRKHLTSETYYTSDYDLATINTYQGGLAFKYAPYKNMRKSFWFNSIELKYSFYYKSDDLKAHILSLVFDGMFEKKKKT